MLSSTILTKFSFPQHSCALRQSHSKSESVIIKQMRMNIKIPVSRRQNEKREMSLKRPIPPGSEDILRYIYNVDIYIKIYMYYIIQFHTKINVGLFIIYLICSIPICRYYHSNSRARWLLQFKCGFKLLMFTRLNH